MARLRFVPLLFPAAVALLAVASFAPVTSTVLERDVWDPILAQIGPGHGDVGYSLVSLAVWGVLAATALAAYWGLAERRPDAFDPRIRTLLLAAPLLAWAPLAHALLASRAVPEVAAIFLAEPLTYATTGAILVAAGALGHLLPARMPVFAMVTAHAVLATALILFFHVDTPWIALVAAPLVAWEASALAIGRGAGGRDAAIVAVGAGLLTAALGRAAVFARVESVLATGIVIALAGVLAFTAWRVTRLAAHRVPRLTIAASIVGFACFAAHALDASTTWLGVVDPFGWGFGGFAEKNPVSAALLTPLYGLPFVLVKLALPAVALYAAHDLAQPPADAEGEPKEPEPRATRREREVLTLLMAFGIFVLGFGPGAANLARMALAP